jgi:hypothetical protein
MNASCFWRALALVFFGSFSAEAAEGLRLVLNPYEGTDWAAVTQHKANLHTHTLLSGGKLFPDQVYSEYARRGYTILVLTEHDFCGHALTQGLDPMKKFGLFTVNGQEYSKGPHVNGFFLDYDTETRDTDPLVGEIAARGGLAVLNHPERYWNPGPGGEVPAETRDAYVALLKKHPALLGIEVYNRNEKSQHDVALWDAVLGAAMPDRPVWGFANDDTHERKHIGYGWEVFLLRELSEPALRQAMTRGSFFFCVRSKAAKGEAESDPPVILGIAHDAAARTLTLSAAADGAVAGDAQYRWIAEGQTVATGPVLRYSQVQGLKGYVRAEVSGKGGVTFTNPFGFRRAE